jgi:hypothetical protein
MELGTKPDFAAAQERWEAFWQHELVDRPVVLITGPRQDRSSVRPPRYLATDARDGAVYAEQAKAVVEATFWAGEAIPVWEVGFGPDQYAAYLGGRLEQSASSPDTTWAVPVVAQWADALPLRLHAERPAWQNMLHLVDTFARVGEGSFLVAVPDLHSNLDALSALRGPERLLLDLLDDPAVVDRAMADVRATYRHVYEGVYAAGRMEKWGTVGWMPLYSTGRFAPVQSDVICMLSSDHVRRWVLPALEEETAFLDHSVMHYDGPQALRHLDDVLAIPTLDGIQWTPGDGAPPMTEWVDLLKQIQAAGKSVWLWASQEEIREVYHRELRPELVVYQTSARSEQEAEAFLKWLAQHT